jgi:MoaA/NifB/PqqE/SkfB family radical SAM enzyme
MTPLIQSIKDFFSQKQPLPPGLYSYQTPQDTEEQYRLHLRIEEDGKGILVINASTVLHLNETAVEYAYHLIKQTDTDIVVDKVSRRYQVDKEQARMDFQDFADQIQTIIETPDLDPVTYLDIERQEPYSGEISAPYRLDCALTYQVNAESKETDAPIDRVDRELTTEEWVAVLHKAHDHGIPHVLFTGGEPTLRKDLPNLIAEAEALGMVTGLLTDGSRLSDDDYRETLLRNGLDHLMIIFDPEDAGDWAVLEKILAEDLFTTVHLTLKKGENLEPHIIKLAEMGTNALSLSAPDPELNNELQKLRDLAAVNQLELVWDMPVPYSSNNPVSLELKSEEFQEAPEGAGKAWLYVEPDGDVLPAQGIYEQILGNMLTDEWQVIWSARP